MDLICDDERPSDSPFVERIWRSHSEQAGTFTSMADSHWGMVVTRYNGKTTLTVRGPETRATSALCPADAEFFGIQFKVGTLMPHLAAKTLMDRQDLTLPEAAGQCFWFYSSVWQLPSYENAEAFIDNLVRDGLLIYDPIVGAALQAQPVPELSLRSVQRRFLQATGLTHGLVYQINRARYATSLLKQGTSILDTVEQAGYFDQPHLTRSLKRWIGQTPAQISAESRAEALSFLYKNESFS